jgi:hypothetical protein
MVQHVGKAAKHCFMTRCSHPSRQGLCVASNVSIVMLNGGTTGCCRSSHSVSSDLQLDVTSDPGSIPGGGDFWGVFFLLPHGFESPEMVYS